MIAMIGLGVIPGFAETRDFVQTERDYRPNPENAAIYGKLFRDYQNIYRGLEQAYREANAVRFESGQ